jgi:hypothetical protein
MDSDYPFDIFKLFLSLCPLTVVLPVLLFFDLWILTTLMTSSNSSYPFVPWQLYCLSFSLIYGFWLPLWHLQTLLIPFSPDSCIACPSFLWFMDSDYPFDIFKLFLSLCPLTVVLPVLLFFDLWILTTPLTSSNSSYPLVLWQLYCLSFFSLIYGFWLPLWYLQTFLNTYISKKGSILDGLSYRIQVNLSQTNWLIGV